MTLEIVKDKILKKIATLIDAKDGINVPPVVDAANGWANVYGMLCSTETMCKYPTREENPFNVEDE